MRRTSTRTAALLTTAGALLLTACGAAVDDTYVIENDPGKAEPIAGTDLSRVSLTDRAVQRLGIETTPVAESPDSTIVPSTALFVDTHGEWWVYTAEGSNVFVRHKVEIAHQDDGRAVLSSGPEPRTEVVTIGVAELYGIEEEIGH